MSYNDAGVIFLYAIKFKTLIIYLMIFVFAITGSVMLYSTVSAGEERDATECIAEVPILMYHAICENPSKEGKFVITKKAFEEDLKYLKQAGYNTISFSELISFVENNIPLPENPIILTFDDGYYNNYCYAFPLLKEYNAKAVISIIGKYTDLYSETPEENPNYSHITWEQAREMCDSGLVEIQNHSYNSHTTDKGRNGTKKKSGESEAAYIEYIYSDVGKLQEEINRNLGYTPTVFAYPFGSVSEASYDILKGMGFKATLSCSEKINEIHMGDSDDLYMLGRFLRTNKRSAESILKK